MLSFCYLVNMIYCYFVVLWFRCQVIKLSWCHVVLFQVFNIPDPDPTWIWPNNEKFQNISFCNFHSFQSWYTILTRRSYHIRKEYYHIIRLKNKLCLLLSSTSHSYNTTAMISEWVCIDTTLEFASRCLHRSSASLRAACSRSSLRFSCSSRCPSCSRQ